MIECTQLNGLPSSVVVDISCWVVEVGYMTRDFIEVFWFKSSQIRNCTSTLEGIGSILTTASPPQKPDEKHFQPYFSTCHTFDNRCVGIYISVCGGVGLA